MAVTLVTGALGAGKGLYCSMLACSAYRNGRRVAANYPLDTTKLSPTGTAPVSVIPKQFSYEDLINLGRGCPENEFENMGILLIDEVSLSLNSRTFKDAERIKFIDWFVHSRKYGWDVYCQVQQAFMLDKQLVEGVSEFIVELSRMDSLRIPFVTAFFELVFPQQFGRTAKKKSLLPHIVKYRTYLAKEKGRKIPIEKGSFRAKDFFGVHDTLSTFGADAGGEGAYSLLPAQQLGIKKREPTGQRWTSRLKTVGQLLAVLFIPVALYFYWFSGASTDETSPVPTITQPPKTATPEPNTPENATTPEAKKAPPLSTTLRLMGHITVKGRTQLIIKDMPSGVVRYVEFYSPSDYQRVDAIEIDGELVTSYSGLAVSEKTNNSSSPAFTLPL